MERKQLVKQTKRLGRRRIAFATIIAVVLVFTMMLLMDQKQTSQVNASETKEQLSAMQDDLERMSEVLHISKDTVDEAAGEYAGGEFIFSADESSLEKTEQDISVTKEEITELIRQIDEGDTTNLTEKYETIENHFSTLEGDFTASIGEIEKIITELSKEEKSSNNTSISELKDVKESLSSFSEELKTSDGELAKLYGNGNQEVKASVDDVSKSVGDVSKSVGDVSKSVSDVSNSVSDVSKSVGDVKNDVSSVSSQLTQNTETILKETTMAFNDNKEAINQNTDARAKEVKEGLQGEEAVTLTALRKEIQDGFEKVFSYVSNGKKRLATALLTNGFSVANKELGELTLGEDEEQKEAFERNAPYYSLDDYITSVEQGMNDLYDKIANKSGVPKDDEPSIEKLIEDGGGIDAVYQKGKKEGDDAGYKRGSDEGYKNGVVAEKKAIQDNIELKDVASAKLPVSEVSTFDDGRAFDEEIAEHGYKLYRIDNNTGKTIVGTFSDGHSNVFVLKVSSGSRSYKSSPTVAAASLLYIPDGGYVYVMTNLRICIDSKPIALIG